VSSQGLVLGATRFRAILHTRGGSGIGRCGFQLRGLLRCRGAVPDWAEALHRIGNLLGEVIEARLTGNTRQPLKVKETADEVTPYLKKAFPFLKDIQYPDGIDTTEKVNSWVAEQGAKYGGWLPVYTLEQYKDPGIDATAKPKNTVGSISPQNATLAPLTESILGM